MRKTQFIITNKTKTTCKIQTLLDTLYKRVNLGKEERYEVPPFFNEKNLK
jgi:hypothetical protein